MWPWINLTSFFLSEVEHLFYTISLISPSGIVLQALLFKEHFYIESITALLETSYIVLNMGPEFINIQLNLQNPYLNLPS